METQKSQEEWQKTFNDAKPDDFIDSRYGYMIKKKYYHLAQKYGFDAIGLIKDSSFSNPKSTLIWDDGVNGNI